MQIEYAIFLGCRRKTSGKRRKQSTLSLCPKMPQPVACDAEIRHRGMESLRYRAKLKELKARDVYTHCKIS